MVNIVFYCNGTHKFILEKMCYYFNYSNYSKLFFYVTSVANATGCSAETCHVYSQTLLSKCCVMQVTALALSKHKNSVRPLVIPSS